MRNFLGNALNKFPINLGFFVFFFTIPEVLFIKITEKMSEEKKFLQASLEGFLKKPLEKFLNKTLGRNFRMNFGKTFRNNIWKNYEGSLSDVAMKFFEKFLDKSPDELCRNYTNFLFDFL